MLILKNAMNCNKMIEKIEKIVTEAKETWYSLSKKAGYKNKYYAKEKLLKALKRTQLVIDFLRPFGYTLKIEKIGKHEVHGK